MKLMHPLNLTWSMALAGMTSLAIAAPALKSDQEKTSYMIGFDIGSNFKDNSLELNLDLVMNGIKDAVAGAKSPIPQEESQKLMATLQKSIQEKMEAKRKTDSEKNVTTGKNYLAENGKKAGVKTTASGLQYKVVTEGKGEAPKATDTVKVHYKGTLIDGTEFDSSYGRGQPATFPVNGVIKGWTEALQLMKPGAKYQLAIPSDLAYGERGAGAKIGPNSTLLFEVELLSIEKKEAPPAEAKVEAKPEEKKN